MTPAERLNVWVADYIDRYGHGPSAVEIAAAKAAVVASTAE